MKCACGEQELELEELAKLEHLDGETALLHMEDGCVEISKKAKPCAFCIDGRCSGACG